MKWRGVDDQGGVKLHDNKVLDIEEHQIMIQVLEVTVTTLELVI